MLTPGEQVRNLLGRYCDLMDAGDWAGVGALFASGRLTSGGSTLAAGPDDVAAFFARGTRLHGGSPRTKHLVLNTQLEVGGGDGSVIVARSSYLVLQAVDGVMPLQPMITGRYVDTFEPAGDAEPTWRERAFTVDLAGDLSHHLAWNPPLEPG